MRGGLSERFGGGGVVVDGRIGRHRWSWVVGGVTAVAIVLFTLASWRNYVELRDERLAAAEAEAARVLVAFEDHATRLFDYADSYLRAVRAYYLEHGAGRPLRRYVAEIGALHSDTFTGILTVADRNGRLIFDSGRDMAPDIDLSDLDYFKHFQSVDEDVVLIDPTRKGRATQKYQFRLVRPIRTGGQFQGVVILTLRTEPIADFYRQFDLGPEGTLMMMQVPERRLIARQPPLPEAYFLSRQDSLALWSHLSDDEAAGRYRTLSPMDGIVRTFQYRRLPDYPVLVQIGVADQDVVEGLAGVRRNMIQQTVIFALVAGMFCALIIVILRKNATLALAEDSSRRAAADLERSNASLTLSNADLERFAYVSSHDLQTPLRIVSSYAQLLDRRYRGRLDADADEFIGFIVAGAKQMSRLITDLLEYSRVSRHGEPLAPLAAGLAVTEALANLRIPIQETGAKVTVGELPVVLADKSQMVSLFQNLVGNALKYRHPDRVPEIAITAQRHTPTRWRFAVEDNGIGIEEEYYGKIFEVFQRLRPDRDGEGSGIGLALCQRIARRAGGDIWVESIPDRGSTFYFTMPDRDAPQ